MNSNKHQQQKLWEMVLITKCEWVSAFSSLFFFFFLLFLLVHSLIRAWLRTIALDECVLFFSTSCNSMQVSSQKFHFCVCARAHTSVYLSRCCNVFLCAHHVFSLALSRQQFWKISEQYFSFFLFLCHHHRCHCCVLLFVKHTAFC